MDRSPPPLHPPPSSIVEGQKKPRKKGEEEENKVKIKELLERVRKLEEIIQHLVTWARDNFGFSSGGGGGGGQGIQKCLTNKERKSRGEEIGDKCRGDGRIEKEVSETCQEIHPRLDDDGGDGDGGKNLGGGHHVVGGEDGDGHGHYEADAIIKVEPLEFDTEFGQGDPLIIVGNSELYHLRKPRRNGQVAVNNDTNDEDNDDSSDSDYSPSNYEMEEDYANSESENDIKSPKTKKCIASTTVLSKDVAESLLPNPYIRLGPELIGRQLLGKFNIKLRPRPTPPPPPPARKKKKKKQLRPLLKKGIRGSVAKFKCDYDEECKYFTNFKRKYLEHYRKHTGERPFLCSTCGKGFRGNSALQSHIKNHPKKGERGSSGFKCDFEECKYFSKRKTHYLEHYRKHTGERPCLCSICGKGFRGQSYLDSHMKSHANDGTFPCQVCKKVFSKQRTLQKHFNENHKDLRRQCEICRAVFSTKGSLWIHKKLKHIDTIKKTICELCGQGFKFITAYKYHMKLHEKPNYKPRGPPLVAPVCTNPPLDGELDVDKVYDVAPKILCREEEGGCGKKFITEHMLQIHIRKHHLTPEQRKVTCSICYRVVRDVDKLKQHMNTVHITERKFVCSICGQAFKVGTHLRRHESGHSNPNWKPRANCKPKKYQRPEEKVEEEEGPEISMESTSNSRTSSNFHGGDYWFMEYQYWSWLRISTISIDSQ